MKSDLRPWIRCNDWEGCQVWEKRTGDDERLCVLFAREPRNGKNPPVWHLSISCRFISLVNTHGGGTLQKRLPTFDEVKEARYRFIPDEVNMGMMFPPKKHWQSLPGSVVLHLWEVPLEMAELENV